LPEVNTKLSGAQNQAKNADSIRGRAGGQVIGGGIVDFVVLDRPGEPGTGVVFLGAETKGDAQGCFEAKDGSRRAGIPLFLGLGGDAGGEDIAELSNGMDGV
jgi:hypothetical protein